MEYELLRERGIWGPEEGSTLDKWMLDMTEGPSRMRKRMVKNDMFYLNYVGADEEKVDVTVSVGDLWPRDEFGAREHGRITLHQEERVKC